MIRRLALVLGIVLALLALYISGIWRSATPDAPLSVEPDPPAAVAADPDAAEIAGPDGESDRTAVPDAVEAGATASKTDGSLLVRMVWSDGAPAPGVVVTLALRRPGQPYDPFRRRVTDAAGQVTFTELTPGPVSLRSSRGGRHKAEVVAGQEIQVRFEIPAGVDVEGQVIDGRGVGVAGAGIWLTTGSTGWLGGNIVTTADADGRFQVRSAPQRQSLGAIAASFHPSALVDLEDHDASKPVQVQLRLTELGGALTGTVTHAGVAVAGAEVCVGKPPRRFPSRRGTHTPRETWTPRIATTGGDGDYTLRGLAPGTHPVIARGPGLGWWRGEVRIEAAATARLDVELPGCFRVSGTVRDADGVPQAGAVVRAFPGPLDESFVQGGQFDYFGVFPYPFAVTDAAGRYRIDGLTPGAVYLYASPGGRPKHDESVIHVKQVLRGEPGDQLTWDPVLAPGHTIRGEVTYRDGVPMKGVFITAHDSRTGKSQSLVADRQGRFRFVNMDPVHYRLGVQYWDAPKGAPPLEASKVFPDQGLVRLVAAFDSPKKQVPGTVVVRVNDAAGRLLSPAALAGILQSSKGWWRTRKPDADGVIRFGKVEPGRYKALALSGEQVIHAGDWFELAPAQDLDLGTLITRSGGSLRIKVQRGKGTEAIEATVWARPDNTNQSRKMVIGRGARHLEQNLNAGKYRITLHATGAATVRTEIEVQAGRVSELTIDLVAAVTCSFAVTMPENREIGGLTTTVRDAAGNTRWNLTETNTPRNPYTRRVSLPPGRYTLSAVTTTGMQGKTEFTIADLAAKPPVVELSIR